VLDERSGGAAAEALAALGVEKVEFRGVGPELGGLAAFHFAGRLEAGDDLRPRNFPCSKTEYAKLRGLANSRLRQIGMRLA
jgi:hypothetical protein